jgi:hypothetical protein
VDGHYTLTDVRPETYDIAVQKTGFKVAMLSGIKLLVNQISIVDFHEERP